MRRENASSALLAGAVLAAVSACDQPPSPSSLQEWSPADHHSFDDGRQASAGPAPGRAPADKKSPEEALTSLVDLTWRQQCTNCHGPAGRGDGQMGLMLHAPDLTNGQWQKSVSDADLAAIIKNGKNRMPKFDLPEAVIGGLVARVRSLRQP